MTSKRTKKRKERMKGWMKQTMSTNQSSRRWTILNLNYLKKFRPKHNSLIRRATLRSRIHLQTLTKRSQKIKHSNNEPYSKNVNLLINLG